VTLTVDSISKRFGDLVANDHISLELEAGTLHAVLGENGAGKSTLMKIITGELAADSGEVRANGVPVPAGSPRAALAAGIGMLHQDPMACLPFTAAENFRLGSRRRPRQAAAELTSTATRFGFKLDPHAITRGLSIGERQQLEIVRLLAAGVRVLILDEPTSGITARQRHDLFAALRELASQGMTVIFVSHKLEEVNDLCTSVTVLRRGQVVGRGHLPRPENELVEMMFDRQTDLGRRQAGGEIGEVVAGVRSLSSGSGRSAISDVDLDVRAGEVIGLAGLEGSGQATLLRTMAGLVPVRRGALTIGGESFVSRPRRTFAAAGVAFVSGGRLEEGLLSGLSISEHLELASGKRWVIDWADADRHAADAIGTFRIKGQPSSPAESLSGGNQQRLLLALLPERLRVLLMEHPTRGLDLDSASYVWRQLLDRRADGTGLVFSSADLDELLTYADRILVFFDGRVIAERLATRTTAEELGTLLGGGSVA
jgi:ABC-type uncharacterized transport system ATPase subunit